MDYIYEPKNVCPVQIRFHIEGNIVTDISFLGGCNGNLKAIGLLVEGKDASEVASLLEGNECGVRGTSCADQFSKAIKKALES